ncbi:putative negative regulation of transcription by glucose-related protein [Dioszegia hungarica]|uniref:Negative regulation of transcription by glucose-related protein n=1 Tax=Dioszegia hungarica TaxID=4972 RepID=A0AA38HBV4_9TREE|nr:putative negative regulation of transcription by glucose-related protein [Dioszegia hungarica]KAI9636709.1 putative negative regulation of transcription by glucose-related protein [Dioszegia hungarica]
MRKGAGISALSRHSQTASSYSTLSSSITASQLSTLESSLSSFKDHLLVFAREHRQDIRKDPAFRHQFQKMCAAIGVDPLAGGGGPGGGGGGKGKGWWTEVLGLGEWQYELAVQVVDVCVSTKEGNGGMIAMPDLISRVERLRTGGRADTGGAEVTEEDILRSLDLLKPLAAGYTTHSIAGTTFVRSVPKELDTDQSLLLVLASDAGGRLTERGVMQTTGWSNVRARTVLEDCVMREGLGWVDEQGDERCVWVIAAVDFGS